MVFLPGLFSRKGVAVPLNFVLPGARRLMTVGCLYGLN